MSVKTKPASPGTSRQAEEQHLQETLAIVRENMEKYSKEVSSLRTSIDDMQAHFHDDNPELINELENTYTMYNFLEKTLARNERAMKKPYFGRIDFHDETLHTQESFYIGRSGISRDVIHPIVVDWRSPVANAYYENGLGRCSYLSPEGRELPIDLQLKRTYEIADGKLQNIFDTEVIANDDILTKYLSRNKQAVLGEIVATIQKEQNEIIRKTPYHNCLVQGVAGSGKTTVAMHRISFILYNYEERFRPEDFYIVGSNRILLNYITGVLPDLDVYGVRQMTMEQLFVRLLYEDWDEQKYSIKSTANAGPGNMVKGHLSWFKKLEDFCRRLERNSIAAESIYLNPQQFVEGIVDGKTGVHDRTGGRPADPKSLVLLMDKDAIERYISQNPTISIQNKINMLNERLRIRVRDEFLGKGVKYTEAERRAIIRAYNGRFGTRTWKTSIFELYRKFLLEQADAGFAVDMPETAFDVYDLAALAYLYKRVKETDEISEAHHVVIDEAQDFGMMVYSALKFCMKNCTYTIMGDVSQNIHFGYGLNDWEELKELYLKDSRASFGILKKSYRNTVEISDFATKILRHGTFAVYPVEPIIRHGEKPQVLSCEDERTLIEKAAKVCRTWQKSGLETIAVICRDDASAARTARELGTFIDVMESSLETAEFGNGIMVLPVEYTKGLEFDAVLILNPTCADYPVDDGHAKLLYVAATRALHELCVLYMGDLTGLITEPVPEKSLTMIEDAPRMAPEMRKIEAQAADAAPEFQDDEISLPDSAPKILNTEICHANDTSKMRSAQISATNHADCELSKSAKIIGTTRPFAVTGANRPVTRSKTSSISTAENHTPYSGTEKNNTAPSTSVKANAAHLATAKNDAAHSITAQNNLARSAPAKPDLLRFAASRPASAPAKSPDQSAGTSVIPFGTPPATELLRPLGHALTDQAVRWVTKQPDALCLHSSYGILRISPVDRNIIRVTFAKGKQMPDTIHPNIVLREPFRKWKYRESGKLIEIKTDDIYLQAEKASGAVAFLTADKRPLLAERKKESHLLEVPPHGRPRARLYLDWQKNEKICALGAGTKAELSLKGIARYISHKRSLDKLPMVVSDKGYGIVLAANGPVFCCNIPSYGAHLCAEHAEWLDYYFIIGRNSQEIITIYDRLCGRNS